MIRKTWMIHKPHSYLPFDLRQQRRIRLLAALHALTADPADLLPELGRVLGRAHVDQEVAEHSDLQVDVYDYLQTEHEKQLE